MSTSMYHTFSMVMTCPPPTTIRDHVDAIRVAFHNRVFRNSIEFVTQRDVLRAPRVPELRFEI